MGDLIGYVIVALLAAGMGLSFFWADPESGTSRSLALFLCLLGLILILNVPKELGIFAAPSVVWLRVFPVCEAIVCIAAFEWILRVGRTAADEKKGSRILSERLVRSAQALITFYGLAGLVFPEVRDRAFVGAFRASLFLEPGYYLFAVPFNGALLLAALAVAYLLRSRIDPAERMRMMALCLATPFLTFALVVPALWRPVTTAIGELVFLAGAVRYHVLQGQRAQFLSRFLSPQVADLVRERGLQSAMRESRFQLSVVACDLRGFTAFSESSAPEEVFQLLRDYYASMSQIVTEFGGTIKDFAGDGILTLVGAPIASTDHAPRAVSMGIKMRDRAKEILGHWQSMGLEVGLGIGIASGHVTVGAIGGTERLEYVAVGPAVNLAARLCSLAESGKVLVDQRTVGLVGENSSVFRFERRGSFELKGLARETTVFEVCTAPETGSGRAAAAGAQQESQS